MPRDSSGVMTAVSGNPVTPGTLVESDWANATVADLIAELTNSLDRNGRGGMLVPMELADGTETAPSITFVNESEMGFYRASAGKLVITIDGEDSVRFSAGGSLEISTDGGDTWIPVITEIPDIPDIPDIVLSTAYSTML